SAWSTSRAMSSAGGRASNAGPLRVVRSRLAPAAHPAPPPRAPAGGGPPASRTVSASLDPWRHWTGLPFDTSGPVEVPRALAPVHCDVERDHAVYVEPNVWMRHPL
ncbi:hypothetical protein ACFV2K_31520, partial [Streptomyces althioticus]